jgi:hypothetical protein
MIDRNIKEILNTISQEVQVKSGSFKKILDVNYLHLELAQGDELFFTDYGIPFLENLLPDNFYNNGWFNEHHERLSGSSCVYKVRTKPVKGKHKDIVLKWNRMAQDVPGGTNLIGTLTEFNSPFEEFSLVMELRNSWKEGAKRLYTHKPLCIYVPAEVLKSWQLGRKDWIMKSKIISHKDIELDMHRNYAVIYEWVKGNDAAMASQNGCLDASELEALTLRVDKEMCRNGFMVSDRKPHHIIVRNNPANELVTDKQGDAVYALIDFEFLHRTSAREKAVRGGKRSKYLVLQANRFKSAETIEFPPHLKPSKIFGSIMYSVKPRVRRVRYG